MDRNAFISTNKFVYALLEGKYIFTKMRRFNCIVKQGCYIHEANIDRVRTTAYQRASYAVDPELLHALILS